MKTSIIFLRHAQTDANIKEKLNGSLDLPLNDTGQKQAREAAEKLRGENFDVVIYGRARRVEQTAQAVLEHLKNKPETLFQADEIREMNFGVFEGMHYREIAEQYPDEWKKYMNDWQTYTFPQGDNISDYYISCRNWIDSVAEKYCKKKILIVGHKGFILNCVSALLTQDGSDVLKRDIGNAQTLTVQL